MMDLIDRSELEPDTEWSEYYDGFTSYSQSQINGAVEVQAIPLDKVKQAREEIENEIKFWSEPSKYNVKPIVAIKNAKAQSYKHCLEILNKLMAESEEK